MSATLSACMTHNAADINGESKSPQHETNAVLNLGLRTVFGLIPHVRDLPDETVLELFRSLDTVLAGLKEESPEMLKQHQTALDALQSALQSLAIQSTNRPQILTMAVEAMLRVASGRPSTSALVAAALTCLKLAHHNRDGVSFTLPPDLDTLIQDLLQEKVFHIPTNARLHSLLRWEPDGFEPMACCIGSDGTVYMLDDSTVCSYQRDGGRLARLTRVSFENQSTESATWNTKFGRCWIGFVQGYLMYRVPSQASGEFGLLNPSTLVSEGTVMQETMSLSVSLVGTTETLLVSGNDEIVAVQLTESGRCVLYAMKLHEGDQGKSLNVVHLVYLESPPPPQTIHVSPLGTSHLLQSKSKWPHKFNCPISGISGNDKTGFIVTKAGQLMYFGNGGVLRRKNTKHPSSVVSPSGTRVSMVSHGFGANHILLLTTTGKVFSLGADDSPALGRGGRPEKFVEVEGLNQLSSFVCCAKDRSAIVTKSGTLYTLGVDDGSGYCCFFSDTEDGHGRLAYDRPRVVEALKSVQVAKVAMGESHTCVMTEEGELWTCGKSDVGQTGQAVKLDVTVPSQVRGLPRIDDVACGKDWSAALDTKGRVWTFGSGAWGQLGTGDFSYNVVPKAIQYLDLPIKSVACGEGTLLMVDLNQDVLLCGRNTTRSNGDDCYTVPERILTGESVHCIGGAAGNSFVALHKAPAPLRETDLYSAHAYMSRKTLHVISQDDETLQSFHIDTGKRQAYLCMAGDGGSDSPVVASCMTMDINSSLLVAVNDSGDIQRFYGSPYAPNDDESADGAFSPGVSRVLDCMLIPVRCDRLTVKMPASLAVGISLLGVCDRATSYKMGKEAINTEDSGDNAVPTTINVCRRFTEFTAGWQNSRRGEFMLFKVNEKIHLDGVGICVGCNGGIYQADYTVMEDERVVATGKTDYYASPTPSTVHQALFIAPAVIEADVWYTIRVRIRSPKSCTNASHHGVDGNAVVFVDQTAFTFQSSNQDNNGNTVSRGPIAELLWHSAKSEERQRDWNLSNDILCEPLNLLGLETVAEIVKILGERVKAGLVDKQEGRGFKDEWPEWAPLLSEITPEMEQHIFFSALRVLSQSWPPSVSKAQEAADSGYVRDVATKIWNVYKMLDGIVHWASQQLTSGGLDVSCENAVQYLLVQCLQTIQTGIRALMPSATLARQWIARFIEQIATCREQQDAETDESAARKDGVANAAPLCLEGTVRVMQAFVLELEDMPFLSSVFIPDPKEEAREASTYEKALSEFVVCEDPSLARSDSILRLFLEHLFMEVRDLPPEFEECSDACARLMATCLMKLTSMSFSSSSNNVEERFCDRFARVPSREWYYGGDTRDAICFKANEDLQIAGMGLYGGSPGVNFRAKIELFEGDSVDKADLLASGTVSYGGAEELFNVYFRSSASIQGGREYTLAARITNADTTSSHGVDGKSTVLNDDDVLFTFFASSHSANCTGVETGQIGRVIYKRDESKTSSTITFSAGFQRFCSVVLFEVASLLSDNIFDENARESLTECESLPIFKIVPLTLSTIAYAMSESRAVIEAMIPSLTELMQPLVRATRILTSDTSDASETKERQTTAPAVERFPVESKHPYIPGSVESYNVAFPEGVTFCTLNFDLRCHTLHKGDCVRIFLGNGAEIWRPMSGDIRSPQSSWPQGALIVPDREFRIELHSCTPDPSIQDEVWKRFGFFCTVTPHTTNSDCRLESLLLLTVQVQTQAAALLTRDHGDRIFSCLDEEAKTVIRATLESDVFLNGIDERFALNSDEIVSFQEELGDKPSQGKDRETRTIAVGRAIEVLREATDGDLSFVLDVALGTSETPGGLMAVSLEQWSNNPNLPLAQTPSPVSHSMFPLTEAPEAEGGGEDSVPLLAPPPALHMRRKSLDLTDDPDETGESETILTDSEGSDLENSPVIGSYSTTTPPLPRSTANDDASPSHNEGAALPRFGGFPRGVSSSDDGGGVSDSELELQVSFNNMKGSNAVPESTRFIFAAMLHHNGLAAQAIAYARQLHSQRLLPSAVVLDGSSLELPQAITDLRNLWKRCAEIAEHLVMFMPKEDQKTPAPSFQTSFQQSKIEQLSGTAFQALENCIFLLQCNPAYQASELAEEAMRQFLRKGSSGNLLSFGGIQALNSPGKSPRRTTPGLFRRSNSVMAVLPEKNDDLQKPARGISTIISSLGDFVTVSHNVLLLKSVMSADRRRAIARKRAFETFNATLKDVKTTKAIQEVVWQLAKMVAPSPAGEGLVNANAEEEEAIYQDYFHDISFAGVHCVTKVRECFHQLFKTLASIAWRSSLTSDLALLVTRCFRIRFHPDDHDFLLNTHVFSVLRRLMARNRDDVFSNEAKFRPTVSTAEDITNYGFLKVSSNDAAKNVLVDGQVETVWESFWSPAWIQLAFGDPEELLLEVSESHETNTSVFEHRDETDCSDDDGKESFSSGNEDSDEFPKVESEKSVASLSEKIQLLVTNEVESEDLSDGSGSDSSSDVPERMVLQGENRPPPPPHRRRSNSKKQRNERVEREENSGRSPARPNDRKGKGKDSIPVKVRNKDDKKYAMLLGTPVQRRLSLSMRRHSRGSAQTFRECPVVSSVLVYVNMKEDGESGVSALSLLVGNLTKELVEVDKVYLTADYVGWVKLVPRNRDERIRFVRVKFHSQGAARCRQIRVFQENEPTALQTERSSAAFSRTQVEAVLSFRFLASQVFGEIVNDFSRNSSLDNGPHDGLRSPLPGQNTDLIRMMSTDLREHVVDQLFTEGSAMKDLQTEVFQMMFRELESECVRFRNEGEHLQSDDRSAFELLSMVTHLLQSDVGKKFMSSPNVVGIILALLLFGSLRVQLHCTMILKEILPSMDPDTRIPSSILEGSVMEDCSIAHFLIICLSKAFCVQIRSLGQPQYETTFNKAQSGRPREWLEGEVENEISKELLSLVQHLAGLRETLQWHVVFRREISAAAVSLSGLQPLAGDPVACAGNLNLWRIMGCMCLTGKSKWKDIIPNFPMSQSMESPDSAQLRPQLICDNDDVSQATVHCKDCDQNFCSECDRVLHLGRMKKGHERKKIEKQGEPITIDQKHGCVRLKISWAIIVIDVNAWRAGVHFKREVKAGACRFCGETINVGITEVGPVCSNSECANLVQKCCVFKHPCGHHCGGIRGEETHLPCLEGCSKGGKVTQDNDDFCLACWTEDLRSQPAVMLECGHVFHHDCIRRLLKGRWTGMRITFGFCTCPLCKSWMVHPAVDDLMKPIRRLYDDVKRKALMRLEYHGLDECEEIAPGGKYENDPEGFALHHYAYYECYKCKEPYFGGDYECAALLRVDQFDPSEHVCASCSSSSAVQLCGKHGKEHLDFKCRYCCTIAAWFCFGTTHFCNSCHEESVRLSDIPNDELPKCPVGPGCIPLDQEECPLGIDHPHTGEEFSLGCGLCRSTSAF